MSELTNKKRSQASGANMPTALLTLVLITGAALYGVVAGAK